MDGREFHLHFSGNRYRGRYISTILLTIPKSAPYSFRASSFRCTYYSYYTLIDLSKCTDTAYSIVVICRINEEFESVNEFALQST